MDALEIIKRINLYKKKYENMDFVENPTNQQNQQVVVVDSNIMNFGTIISIMIGLYAAYLSYECNSKKNIPEMSKIFFSIFAYIFGFFYLIYYYLFQYDSCHSL